MSKLTLSVKDEVVVRAKRYAKRRGQSVSEMVETYLDVVSKPAKKATFNDAARAPITRSLVGCLKGADPDDYKRYLEAKYL